MWIRSQVAILRLRRQLVSINRLNSHAIQSLNVVQYVNMFLTTGHWCLTDYD